MSRERSTYRADDDYSRQRGLRGHERRVTVRWQAIPGQETDDAGQRAVDEIVVAGVHVEMMDDANCWANICGLRVWIRAYTVKGQRQPRLVITAEPESCGEVAS